MDRQTQKQIVKQRLDDAGQVDNFWAIQNFILRLGAIVHELRKEGYEIEGAYGRELGKDKPLWKNYYYTKVAPKVQPPLI